MRGKRTGRAGRSRGRLGLVALIASAANVLMVGWVGVPVELYQWAAVLGLETVLLAMGFLLLRPGKNAREVLWQEDAELAQVIKGRLRKYGDGGADGSTSSRQSG